MARERIILCKTVPENRTIAVIGSDREGNVVQRRAAVCWGGVLCDKSKMAARETTCLWIGL